jgi:hypothetical protein
MAAVLITFLCTASYEMSCADGFPLGYFIDPHSPARGDQYASQSGVSAEYTYILIGGCLLVIESVLLIVLIALRRRRMRQP